MKSPFALLTSLVLLSACGQTGPLYMPKTPPKAAPVTQTVKPPAPAAGVSQPLGSSNSTSVEATTPIPATTPAPAPH